MGVPPAAHRVVSPVRGLRGELRLPSDKSIAHRALIANALAEGTASITVVAPGRDVRSTVEAIAGLRSRVARGLDGEVDTEMTFFLEGSGTGGALGRSNRSAEVELDCGNSGTTMRLMAGVAASQGFPIRLFGDASLQARPMERVAAPLRRMGATVTTEAGTAPMTVVGHRPLEAHAHPLPQASAQVLGAICFAALAADGMTRISTPGPTRDHTERLLRWMGAPIERDGLETIVRGPTGLTARSLVVPGDISSAAAWLVAASLHPNAEVRLLGVGLNPTRTAVIEVLREMGASIEVAPAADGEGPEPLGDLTVRTADQLHGITVAGPRVAALIDELPLLGVAMAAADGVSVLRDATELRVKESDRIAAMVANLAAIGAHVGERPDGWSIRRGSPRSARITTDGDHRIAIAFAVAALGGLTPRVEIDDPSCIDVSYPTFWAHVEQVSSSPTGTGV